MPTAPETLRDVASDINAVVCILTGIRKAPVDAPESNLPFPFLVTIVKDGRWTPSPAGWMTGLINVQVQLHVARKDLPRDIQAADVYSISVPKAIYAALASFAYIQNVGVIEFAHGPIGWENTSPPDTYGYVWTIRDVKVQLSLT